MSPDCCALTCAVAVLDGLVTAGIAPGAVLPPGAPDGGVVADEYVLLVSGLGLDLLAANDAPGCIILDVLLALAQQQGIALRRLGGVPVLLHDAGFGLLFQQLLAALEAAMVGLSLGGRSLYVHDILL